MALVAIPPPASICVGVDIGQRVDPTAIVVAEQQETPTGTSFTVRHLERRPLGEAYPRVAERVAAVVLNTARYVWQQRQGRGDLRVFLALDATGVGRPVCELVQEALDRPALATLRATVRVEYCIFTYGDHLTRVAGERRVGKAYLVSRLQSLLQTGRVALPRTAEAEALAAELLDYEIMVDPDGDAKFGAFAVGTHDDLVTALGLAVIEDRRTGSSAAFDEAGRRIA